MQMRLFLAVLGIVAAGEAFAHPAVSVVIDSRGNVYYSDLKQVWRVAPDGTRSVAVPNVHTHELYLDARDNLFGEHLWYEGERIDKWGHYVWKRSREGKVSIVIPRTEGFLRNYSFVRDRAGNMFFANDARTEILRRAPNGRVSVHARGFRDIRWMHATPGGTVFLVDDGDVVRVKNGRVTRLARNLAARFRLWRPHVGSRHALMGLWTDRAENVYVADHIRGEVKRITPAGQIATIARSSMPWSPTGGAIAPNGDLWVGAGEFSDTTGAIAENPPDPASLICVDPS